MSAARACRNVAPPGAYGLGGLLSLGRGDLDRGGQQRQSGDDAVHHASATAPGDTRGSIVSMTSRCKLPRECTRKDVHVVLLSIGRLLSAVAHGRAAVGDFDIGGGQTTRSATESFFPGGVDSGLA